MLSYQKTSLIFGQQFFIPSNARSLVQTLANQQSLVWSFFTVPSRQLFICILRGLIQSSSLRTKVEGYLAKYKSNRGHHLSPTFPFWFFFFFRSVDSRAVCPVLLGQLKDQPFSFISCRLSETKNPLENHFPIHQLVGGVGVSEVGVQIWQGRKFVFFIYHRRR